MAGGGGLRGQEAEEGETLNEGGRGKRFKSMDELLQPKF